MENPNPLKLVELIGPAGAGKSSVIKELIAKNGSFYLGDDLQLKRIDHFPLFIKNVPFLLDQFVTRGDFDSRQFNWDELKSMVYLRSAREIFALQHVNTHNAIILLDHGPVFKLATLYEFGPDKVKDKVFEKWWQMMFIQWAGGLDLIISLDAPDDVLHERINSRTQKHAVKNRSGEEASNFLNRYRDAFDYVTMHLSNYGELNYIQLDTENMTTAKVAEEILTQGNLLIKTPKFDRVLN